MGLLLSCLPLGSLTQLHRAGLLAWKSRNGLTDTPGDHAAVAGHQVLLHMAIPHPITLDGVFPEPFGAVF